MVPRLGFDTIINSFTGVNALTGFNFDVTPGEIHNLLVKTVRASRRSCAFCQACSIQPPARFSPMAQPSPR